MDELYVIEEEMREFLGPQIDKLRFIRELTRQVNLGDELSVEGENNECVARGLHEILFESTQAYDKVHGVVKDIIRHHEKDNHDR